jgi:hypothetical protein
MLNQFIFLSLLISVPFLYSCKQGPTQEEIEKESDVVLTKYHTNFDFKSKKFYACNNQIYLLSNERPKDSLDPQSANTLISVIRNQMNSRNYQEVYKLNGVFGYDSPTGFVKQDPDLGFNVTLYKNTTKEVDVYPGGGYYGGYWGWGYGYYYPSYPVAYTYEYTEGLVVVDLFEFKVITNPNDTYTVHWDGIGRGIGIESKYSSLQRSENAINQMFIQSPYILRPIN